MKILGAVALAMFLPFLFASTASAAPVTVPLLTASPFAILAATAITDVPTSTIIGDAGLTPTTGAAIGLGCAEVTGHIYAVDAFGPGPCALNNPGLLTVAKNDETNAFTDAQGRTPDVTYITGDNQLGGLTLVPGVYNFPHAATANLIGNLTLNGNADAVWIFQAPADLVFASGSTVTMTGGAQACNVFWETGSSATINGTATVRGTILASTSITVKGGATIEGRLLAGTGDVTLINDTITKPASCLTQAAVDSANAAAAQAAAAQAAAAQAAAVQAAAAQATAQAAAQAAAAQAAALAATQAAAAQAAATAQAAKVAKAAQAARTARAAAATRARARTAAVKAARKTIAKRRAAVRAAKSTALAAFTG
jgi:hypothetical protein